MQNTKQKFRQSSIVFEKLWNWKLWWAATILKFNIFHQNSAHIFCLPLSTKECVGFFIFYLDLELFAKIKKDLVSMPFFTFSLKMFLNVVFTLSLITQDLSKIKKISGTLL